MAHANDIDHSCTIIDRIDDTMVADTDAPQIEISFELLHSRWPRLRAKPDELCVHARRNAGGKIFDVARGAIGNDDRVLSHEACQP